MLALEKYKDFLDNGTNEGQNWSYFPSVPKSRYYTMKFAFEHFEKNGGQSIAELGCIRSFVHGGLKGCDADDTSYWTPDQPIRWDWGAGFFSRMAAESLAHLSPTIHAVDISPNHVQRCRTVTASYSNIFRYHVSDSVAFLRGFDGKIDLLYLDTGDMTPIEPTAQLQLAEAHEIVERNILSPKGIILIDDVKNTTPKKFGEQSNLGKSKYSLPYFIANGYEVVMDEYQVALCRR